MGAIRKLRNSMTFLLLVGVVLLVAQRALLSGSAAYPCSGTLTGTLGPGTGTVSLFGMGQQISTNTAVNGTFDGDTTGGSLMVTLNSNYSVPSIGQSGHVSGSAKGTYAMNIDSSGAITGTATIPLTGDFGGQVNITLQGTESSTGSLTGTWSGTMTLTKVTGPLGTFSSNIAAPGSGQFTGTEQRSSGQTVASTSSSVSATVGAVSTTAAPTSTAEMVSTPENMTQSSSQGSSYLPYALVAVVVIIIVAAALALKMRRPKKPTS